MKLRTIALVTGTVLTAAACERDEGPAEDVGMGTQEEEPVTAAEPVEQAGQEVEEGEQKAEKAGQQASQEIQPVAGQDETEKQEAQELVEKAAATLKKMKADPNLKKLLAQSKGVFIVPEYGRAGLGIGGRGGEGVLLAHQDNEWSDPVFYDIGGVSVGAQIGAEGGEIAMILMTDQALSSFEGDDTFSLNASGDFTFADYSKLEQASLGKDAGSVVFWSDMEGAFAGATLSATDISWDDEANPAYYDKRATPQMIMGGKVEGPRSTPLEQELQGM